MKVNFRANQCRAARLIANVTDMKAACLFTAITQFILMNASAEEPNKWKKPEGEPLFVAISRDNEEMNRA